MDHTENVPLGSGSYPHFAPALSPDGTRVAYVAFSSVSSAEIMTAALDGTEVHRLTHDENTPDEDIDTNPAWSPDGSQIAFVSGNRLSLMDADGSNMQSLAPSVVLEGHPSGLAPLWAPNGSRIAIVGREESTEDGVRYVLYTVHPNGSGLSRITEVHGPAPASWSPDSEWLAFSRGVGEERAVYVSRPDGTALRQVVRGYDGPVSWSPDGAWLALSSGDGDEKKRGIYTVRPDGTDLRQVVSGYGGPVLRSWKVNETGREGATVTVPVGVIPPIFLTNAVDNTPIAWSQDGSQLAVLAIVPPFSPYDYDVMLFTIARDGTNKRLLVRGNGYRLVAEHSDWRDVSRDISMCAEGYVVPNPEDNPGLVQDCETLLVMRDKLAGDTFLSWSADTPIEEWEALHISCRRDGSCK